MTESDDEKLRKNETAVDKAIREAYERGDFDNLPGLGKPLNLNHLRYIPNAYRLAYPIMSENEISPEWIGLSKEISTEFDQAKDALKQAGVRYQRQMRTAELKPGVGAVRLRLNAQDEWADAQASFCDAVRVINSKINLLNLKVPASHLTRDNLNTERELAAITVLFD